nr:hypothetical protein [Tanacetum cinerariifolium]
MPPTLDLSFNGLDEFVNEPVVTNCKATSSEEELTVVRKYDDAPSIKEWVSDDEKEDVSQPKIEKKIVRPSIVKIEVVKSKQYEKTTRETIKQVEQLRQNTQSPRGNQRNWNNMMSQKLGSNFKMFNKADKGFFVGYSLNSKAFKVFNSRTRIVEENLHIKFSESTPNVVGSGPDWLFDIDALTRIMNYEPLVACTQSNGFAGTKASYNASQARKETKPVKNYILLSLWTAEPPFSQDPKSSHDDGSKPSSDDGKKVDEDPRKESERKNQEKEDNVNNTNNVNTTGNVNTISLTVNAASTNEVSAIGEKINIELPFDPKMPALEDDIIFDFSSDDEDDDAVADMNNLDITIQVSLILTIRIHKDHPLDQVIGDFQSATQTRKMSNNLEEHGFVSTIQQRTNHKDLQNYLFACFLSQEEPKKIEEEVYVCQPPGFEDLDIPDKVYKVEKALYRLHQAPKAWFTEVKTASTSMETQKPLLKDEYGKEVDVHMYRSMNGSLMYLTSARPYIMFAVCACARYQVNPKVAYADSDYAGASLDTKSTTKGCQFLGCRLISWQCKKQIVVVNSITEAEYVAASSCCGQVLWI